MPVPSVLRVREARVVRLHRFTSELFELECTLVDREEFAFIAGQWVYLHLVDEVGASLAKGAFSLANVPDETGVLRFGVKIYGRLTATLAEMRAGDRVGVQGPFGRFVLPAEDAPLAMFGGGIGVTPLRSMIQAALEDRSRRAPIALFWASKAEEDLIYHAEFLAWQKAHPGRFTYVPSLTREHRADWPGERGRLEDRMLDQAGFPWDQAHAFSCGPQLFMDGVKNLLILRGIEGKPRYHEERFI